jgi:hypothetical protein
MHEFVNGAGRVPSGKEALGATFAIPDHALKIPHRIFVVFDRVPG